MTNLRMDTGRQSYRQVLEKSYLIALTLIIAVLQLVPILERSKSYPEPVPINIVVQEIPVTKQGIFRPPPPRPAVPIPSEDESIPLDETIHITELNFDNSSLSDLGIQSTGHMYTQPRPIAEVIPEYPPEDYKKKVTGVVKLNVLIDKRGRVTDVIVLENTTGSKRCADAAKAAALKCRYLPARQGNKPVESWTIRRVTYEIPE